MTRQMLRHMRCRRSPGDRRRGAFMVLAVFCLIVCMGLTAFSIDTGHITLNKTLMQNAVDAASLAAAMEITHAIENAPLDTTDPTAYAREQARLTAAHVAELNGVYIDPSRDVFFGLRSFNTDTEKFEIEWGVEPANSVRVIARRDNDDVAQPDAKLPLFFAGVLGEDRATLRAQGTAFIESRDISVVLDFSGSMRYDSLFRSDSISKLGKSNIRENLKKMYWELGLADGSVGTLDHTDPDNSSSLRDAENKWLVVHSPPAENLGDPNVDVTFKYDRIDVVSDQPYDKIKLEFVDGTIQTITDNASSGTYGGTGSNSGKNISTAWAIFAGEDVTLSGQSASGCRPHIEVTFSGDGKSIFVESSKDLSNVVLEFTDGSHYKFDNLNQGRTGTFQGIGQHAGKTIEQVWIKSGCNASGEGSGYGERFDSPVTQQTSIAIEFEDSNVNVKAYFDLDTVPYPYPSGSWDSYIDYVRSDADVHRGGHREMYGGITFIHYLLDQKPYHDQTPALAKTSHFPFHAVREGNRLFLNFLEDLGFGDHVGLVSYDTDRRVEQLLNEDGQSIDISTDPMGAHYDALRTILDYKQASHYSNRTNIGGGLREAKQLLDDHGRPGVRPPSC